MVILKVEAGTRADKVVIIAVAIGATTTLAVAINRDTVVARCATTSIRVADQHPTPIQVLAADNPATRDGYRPSVDKVTLHLRKSTTVVCFACFFLTFIFFVIVHFFSFLS